MIDRATLDPMLRAALRTADSMMPSCFPPRRPVDPKITSESASLGRPSAPEAGAVPVLSALELETVVRAFSFSYADSRSTTC